MPGEIPGEITGEAVYDMVSPADGHILPLDQVKDEVFAGRVLGDGFAVEAYQRPYPFTGRRYN